MRMVPIFVIVVVTLGVAALLLACSHTEAKDPEPQPPLSLTLAPGDLFEPTVTEGVPVTYVLGNGGKSPALVNSRMLVNAADRPHEVVFQVTGPDKKPRRFTALVNASAESRGWKTLKPGTRVTQTARLGLLYDFSQKGFYSVQAVYENRQDAPAGSALPAWKGTVASNVLRIEIK